EINTINERRTDSDNDNDNVVDLKTDPYHFDENRSSGRITTYGEADGEASLKITGSIGSVGGATREVLLDTRDDDDDTAASEIDEADFYDSTGEFFFSHGLINRGSIEANGWYDNFKADAVLLDTNAVIHGGLFNSGTISATAYNEDARALIIGNGATLNDGLRSDNAVLLNEGTISAFVGTHTGSNYFDESEEYKATAITLAAGANLPSDAVFINRSTVSANATHTKAETSDADDDNVAIAFDFSAYNGNVNITQELLKVDALLDPNAAKSAANPYLGSGDTDIDRAGATNADDEIVGDGVIDTRDINTPRIVGDVNFGGGANIFAIKAGTVSGNIDFGHGNDTLNLSNEIQDDADDDYTAPTTSVTGRITNSDGDLDISIGERTRLHLVGQEGDADTETENLAIDSLTLNGDLMVAVDHKQLSADTPLLTVTDLTLGNAATITPRLIGLPEDPNEETRIDIVSYGNQVTLSSALLNNEETPFIYNVSLSDENSTISASFNIKSASAFGLNQAESDALSTVLAHFADDENLATAITSINNADDFEAAYRQLLPHYSDGTAQQLSGLADMATGAVSQHLQLINAGGRRGGDGWVQQFGDYRKQDASANGATVSGTSYAIALGYDLPVSAIDALGLYLQMGFSAVNEKSATINEIKGDGISYGAYLSDKIGPLHYQLNAAYGFVGLESDRLINFAGLVDQAEASWDATSTAASARLAYPILQNEHLLRLEAGMDFFRLEHDDYSESEIVGRNFAMQIKGGESEKTSQFIGLRGGYRRGGGDPVAVVWEPNYYLGWRTTSDISPYRATTNFVGSDESFTLQSHIEPEDALDIGLGFAAHNDYFAFEFNYRARIADDEETHGGGVSIRLLF
ncbi:MAG: autotransporter outer membrane beta-barrel domain-containing protein, partial [Parvibaculales bacterium]